MICDEKWKNIATKPIFDEQLWLLKLRNVSWAQSLH